ncbi:FtsX-like permease family protein [Crocinitomicaceae bacterium]|nr:FtsX-like permease family protein [Crocinitomicaceae bacterium]
MRISMISIALTIVVNVITIAVVTGFQNEIRKKIVGFSAPLFIMKDGNKNIYESDPIRIDQKKIAQLEEIDGIQSVAPVIYKPALIRSDKFSDAKNEGSFKQEVTGVVLKGIDRQYPMDFLKSQLVSGKLPSFDGTNKEIVLSKKICNDLNFKIGDEIAIFFVKKRSLMKRFKIAGIFETGIEKIDNEIIFASLSSVQELNDFGVAQENSLNFVSGFEVQINNWDDLESKHQKIDEIIELEPNEHGEVLRVINILESENEIFSWLSFLDTNVLIIIILMLIIGIINIGSVLLVMIVIRSNFIGILKALGANNWSIRKIFLYQTASIILKGMIIGNIIGLVLCYLQYEYQILKLDATVYYLSEVPIELSMTNVIAINIITFIVCMLSLLIPSMVISRVSPSKSIKFN